MEEMPTIRIGDYEIKDDCLCLKNIDWPDGKLSDAFLVVNIVEDKIKKKIDCMENNLTIPLSDMYGEFHRCLDLEGKISIELIRNGESVEYYVALNTEKPKAKLYVLDKVPCGEDEMCIFHSRTRGELQISYAPIEENVRRRVITYITKFNLKKNEIYMEGNADCIGGSLEAIRLLYREDPSVYVDYPVTLTKIDGNRYSFSVEIDLSKIDWIKYFWDFHAVVAFQNEIALSRVKVDSIPVRKELSKKIIRFTYKPSNDYVVFPYLNKNNNFCLQYRLKHKYDSVYYKCKETLAVWTYKALKPIIDKKCRWLICEKFSQTAQDNSFYFFNYCHDVKKNDNVYYIIDKKSVDYKHVKDKRKHVIQFMSFKHMIYLQARGILVSSEPKIHYYGWKIGRGRVRLVYYDKPFVFLQHGVMGFKRIMNLSKNTINNAAIFITSSEYEKQIIVDNFLYDEDEVAVTGQCRWDVLEDKVDKTKQREIIIMPSWRIWLEGLSNEEFLETNYYKKVSELIQNKELMDAVKKHDAKVTFIIHPRLKEYVKNFESDNDNLSIYQFGEEPINEVLMRASLLITDYSSVSWDMYYMQKPVIFYKFDLEEYEEKQGSYIDSHEEVIGDITYDADALVKTLEEHMDTDYQMKQKYIDNQSKYLKYRDHNNCERIYDTICDKLAAYIKE